MGRPLWSDAQGRAKLDSSILRMLCAGKVQHAEAGMPHAPLLCGMHARAARHPAPVQPCFKTLKTLSARARSRGQLL